MIYVSRLNKRTLEVQVLPGDIWITATIVITKCEFMVMGVRATR